MIFEIETPFEGFRNDIADIVRIFCGEGSAVPPGGGGDCRLIHTHTTAGDHWTERVELISGERTFEHVLSDTAAKGSPLEEKRMLKRLIKRTCYEAMKAYTGRQPAWGSMTGIRPTRLYYQQMEAGLDRDRARDAVRSIFDLSDEKLSLLDEVLDAQQGMIEHDPSVCDLYVGIPFCTTRCSYCSFSSGEIGDGHLVEPYLAALEKEIEACARMARELGLKIRVGYVGGGTPSSLSAKQMDRLLRAMTRSFGTLEELTVEAGRPDTLDEEKFRVLKAHPVTRISINPQTMNDETLVKIGRAHTAAQIVECYEMARRLGFDDINMDVIAALPDETYEMFAHTMDRIREMKPESLTVHTLAIKRSSELHRRKFDTLTRTVSDMVGLGRETAHAMGMSAYYLYRQKYMAENLENVGYALERSRCRYNVDNMEETTSVLALGAGGISKRVTGMDGKILRAPNVANIEQYIARADEMIERKRAVFTADISGVNDEDPQ